MRIPLILHARPSNHVGATVLLPDGKWVIESDHKESSLTLAHFPMEKQRWQQYELVDGLEITGNAQVKVDFLVRGKEDRINVHARQVPTTTDG